MTVSVGSAMRPVRPIVLIVDDESPVLEALSALLAPRVEPLFRVETASSAEEALEVVANAGRTPLALVISDERMPGRQGTELLTLLKQRDAQRQSGRMIVTAYAGLPSAKAAINEAEVDRYYPKPWDAEKRLLPAVAEVLERFGARSGLDRFLLAQPADPARDLEAIRELRRAWWEYTELMGLSAEDAGIEAPSFDEPGDNHALHVIAESVSPRERYFVGALRALRPEASGPWMLDGLALLPEAAAPEVEALLVRTISIAACEHAPAEIRCEVPALRRELYESLGFAVVTDASDEPGPGTVMMAASLFRVPENTDLTDSLYIPPNTALVGPRVVFMTRFRSERRLCSCSQAACPAHDYAEPRRGYYCPLDLAEGRQPDQYPRRET